MVSRRKAALVSLVALGTAAAVAAAPATSNAAADSHGVAVVTKGLDGPFGLQATRGGHGGFVVAESESGQVTRIFSNGAKHAILNGVPGVAGVAASPRRVFAVIGGPNEQGAPSGGIYGPSKVLRMNYRGGHVRVIADLMAYELKHNPDGQVQFVNGAPVDSLSNPFAMTWSRRFGLFVADGGANDVLQINPRTGKIRTFFVPHTVKNVPACKAPDANANPGTQGCDPVPTGVQVLGNSVYVSTLGAEAPQAGRIYKLNAHTGKVQRVWKGFTAPTGVAVRPDGTIYFSQVLFGAPPARTAAFSPSSIGRITRIHDGHVRNAAVTMPTGLVLKNGDLYASAWSVASFFNMTHAGQVVKVKERAFK